MSDPINPPSAFLQLLEGRAPIELSALMLRLPLLRLTVPHGRGAPVIVLPGFLADDASTWLLRRFLDSIGYDAHPWGLGRNTGPGTALVDGVLALVRKLAAKRRGSSDGAEAKKGTTANDERVNLVGWSRGGIIAREVARARADLVRQVITLGTPVHGGPSASSIGRLASVSLGMSAEALHALQRARERTPIKVPITAIYSKSDGIVAWRAAIDHVSPDVQHIEVDSSHVGLGVNADVYRIVAERLRSPR
jgi:pimeloyl-ACP methyl ester carboxylesterase